MLSVVEYEHLRGTMSGLGGEYSTFQVVGALFGIANLMFCEIKTLNKRMTTSRQDPTEMETWQSIHEVSRNNTPPKSSASGE